MDRLLWIFVGLFFCLVVVGLGAHWVVLKRLREEHTAKYRSLGQPSWDDLGWGVGDANRMYWRFVRSGSHRAMGDPILSACVVFVRLSEYVGYILLAALVVGAAVSRIH